MGVTGSRLTGDVPLRRIQFSMGPSCPGRRHNHHQPAATEAARGGMQRLAQEHRTAGND